ncbi:hypothetical protein [Chromobacterium amazonense]|uniref:hypothetical protein n=1 Tax=Chromobacterium amazonense TaxID=1382803 RepID=UPI003F79535E
MRTKKKPLDSGAFFAEYGNVGNDGGKQQRRRATHAGVADAASLSCCLFHACIPNKIVGIYPISNYVGKANACRSMQFSSAFSLDLACGWQKWPPRRLRQGGAAGRIGIFVARLSNLVDLQQIKLRPCKSSPRG